MPYTPDPNDASETEKIAAARTAPSLQRQSTTGDTRQESPGSPDAELTNSEAADGIRPRPDRNRHNGRTGQPLPSFSFGELLYRFSATMASGIAVMLVVLIGWMLWEEVFSPSAGKGKEVAGEPAVHTPDAGMAVAGKQANLNKVSEEQSTGTVSGESVNIEEARPAQRPFLPPPTKAEPSQPTLHEQRRFNEALAEAFDLLGQRKLAEANARIEAAAELGLTDVQQDRIAGMRQLHSGVENFWTAYRNGYRRLSSRNTLTVGQTTGMVVEVTPAQLVVRVQGKNRRYDPNQMPYKLARVIALRWFNKNDPSTAINAGAFDLVDPAGSKDESAKLWKAAAKHGKNVDLLMPLLEMRP